MKKLCNTLSLLFSLSPSKINKSYNAKIEKNDRCMYKIHHIYITMDAQMETLKMENARLKQMLGSYMKEDFDKIRRINQEKDLQQRRELCCLFKVNM